MKLIKAIEKRYSCRHYLSKTIEKEKLDLIFEAARLAPSAKNLQDWRFVAVTDPEQKHKVAIAANEQMFLEQAGVIIAACSNCDQTMRCGQKVSAIDVSIALEHISLQAAELGLATCWIGSFFPEKVRKVLGIPQNIEIVELMSIGYPADEERHNKREPIENILSYNKWDF